MGSCNLCGQVFLINSWLKMHIISKHQTNHKTSLSLAPYGVCSSFVSSGTTEGVWIGDLFEKHEYVFSGITFVSFFSRGYTRAYRCICRKLFFSTWQSNEHKQITCGTQEVAAERICWRDPMVRKPRLLKSTSLSCGMWRTSTSSSTNLSMWLARP